MMVAVTTPIDDKAETLTASAIKAMLGLADTVSPATEFVLGKLTEVLRVEMLRGRANTSPASAAADPVVNRALQFVHADPTRRWTVEDLARKAGASRTALTVRFKAAMGRPPIEYVTDCRMQIAATRLQNRDGNLAAIAADIGYESEAAFSRAFKRVTGMAPSRWRKAGSA